MLFLLTMPVRLLDRELDEEAEEEAVDTTQADDNDVEEDRDTKRRRIEPSQSEKSESQTEQPPSGLLSADTLELPDELWLGWCEKVMAHYRSDLRGTSTDG